MKGSQNSYYQISKSNRNSNKSSSQLFPNQLGRTNLNTSKGYSHTNIINSKSQNEAKKLNPEIIKEIADKHYEIAMKHVFKKNDQHRRMVQNEKMRARLETQPLTEHHTFHPVLINTTRTSIKNEAKKGSDPKYKQLRKWGINHGAIRRQSVIQGQVKLMRNSIEKPREIRALNRSLDISKSLILERSSLEKSIGTTFIQSQFYRSSSQIPGVQKYYLNQTKAQLSKIRKEKLFYKGNERTGFYF